MFAKQEAPEEPDKTIEQLKDAEYEKHLIEAVKRGIDDIEQGRFTTSIDDAFRKAAILRNQR